jgi:anaerobic ribonucleoside-triphosphate reductase
MLRAGNVPDGMTVAEVNAYINYMMKQHPDIKSGRLDIELAGEDVELTLTPDVMRFQRIRRITGYLVGTLDRFNNAKRSEVDDRVKHISV